MAVDDTTVTTTAPAPVPARRRFLLGAGALGVGAVFAACGDDEDDAGGRSSSTSSEPGQTTSSTEGSGDASGDMAVAMTAASLEVLAVSTYGSALEAANGGALGTVPPAVAEFVTTAQSQHQAHLDAWNGVIEAGGGTAVSEPPADLAQSVTEQFRQVTDVTGAARLALDLEETAAQTYLAAVPSLQSAEAIELAGAICCIDRQHAAILRFVLGEYPVPDVFAPTDMAYSG